MSNFYRKSLIPLVFILAFVTKGYSSHIVGGIITYTYMGSNNYSVTLKLYRDCSGIALPGSAVISIFSADGSAYTPSSSVTFNLGATNSIPLVLPPCATAPNPTPCVQEGVYTGTLNLPPSPGGLHLVYSTCCRNAAVQNITNPGGTGETFYAFIPCYNKIWSEDFTLPNGTTVDNGPTSWSLTNGPTPPTSAQVNNGAYEVVGSNNGSVLWSSQVINISSYTAGVNLSADISKAGTNFGNNDTLKLYYSINGGAKVLWATNGQNTGNWASPRFATSTGLVGNTIQLFVKEHFNSNNNSTGKTFDVDMVNVYDNTFLNNSSPDFNNLPPLLFCSTNSFTLNQSASDANGDSLVYSMYTPYTDTPTPTYPNNIFTPPLITWVAGYSATSPFNAGGPGVTINPSTGVITGVANTNGRFVFGVKVQEYRNGVLLDEVVRDYQVTSVTCPPFVPAAPTITANTPLCVGQTLSMTASFTAGATYNWTGPNSFTATGTSASVVNVSTLSAGVYSVTATISGCTGPPGTVAVVVNTVPATPTVTANTPLCVGQTLSLTATAQVGATYNWNGPNSFTSAVQNPTIGGITLAGAGTYSVTRTVSGCTSPNGTVNVVVNPIPSAPGVGANTPLCAGQTLSLTSTFTAGATYSWTGPNSFTSNVQNPTIAGVTIAGSGVYSVIATVGGCSGPAGTVSVTVNNAPSAPTASANTPICVGQTLSLTASFTAGVTYNWSGPNGFVSAVQNPTIGNITVAGSGVYTVNGTNGTCAGPSSTIAVTVNTIPVAPTAGANTPLCTGQTLSLTSTFSAGATYNWVGPNSFTSAVQNPTLAGATPAATGVYSVSATIGGCTGPVGTISVNVSNQPAAPVTGANSPICVGQTLSLTATFTAGLTYSWTGPNGFTSNVQNPTIAGITLAGSGTYSVFATTTGGCSGPVGTIAVTVNPSPAAPTAGSNSTLCAGQTLSLTAAPNGANSYSWSGPNSFTSNVQNPTIAGTTTLATGMYSVTQIVNGCPSPVGTVSVTIHGIPSAPTAGSNSTLCAGSTLSLTALPNGANSYNWTGPNGFISAVQNPTIGAVTVAASGTYSVTQTVLGCAGPAGTVAVTVNPIPSAPTPGSNGPICSGQTLSLTGLPNGLTYNWTGPNSFTSNVQNPTIAGATTLAAGVYSLTVNSLGCNSPAGTVGVVVNPIPSAPTAGGTPTLCAGSTISLTSTNPGGATFSWTGPNGFTSNVQNPTIAGATTLATGMYSVTVTVGGCTSLPGTFSVNVYGIPGPPALGANSPLCTGQTLSLTAAFIAGASYNWSGPNGFVSATQNPTIGGITLAGAGNYTCAVNVSGCGSSGSSISVTINPTPAAPTAGSNSTLCAGSTLNLTAAPNGANSYSWTGPNTFTSNLQNPSIVGATTLATGMYSVTQTVNGCTSPAGTVSVTIHGIPGTPTASSNSTLCAGSTLSLTSLPNGANSYNWTGPNGFTSAVQNPTIGVVTVAASGTYSVTQTVLGCTGPAGTVAVTVNPIPATPTASANTPICALTTLSLSASPNGAFAYNWTGPNSFTSNVQNPTIVNPTVSASGTYSVTQTVLGCTSPAGTVAVTVNATPAAPTAGGTATLCAGSTISLTSTNPGGATFSWTGPNGFTSNVQNPTIVGASTLATGMYSVTATVAGCTGPAGTFSVNVYGIPGPPNLGANSPLCTGQTLSLTAAFVAGASYNWSGPNGFLSATQNPTIGNVSLLAAGIYSCAINVSGCGGSSSTLSVTVNPTPAAPTAGSNSSLCAGSTLSLNAIPGGANSYSWTGPNTFTSNVQNPNIVGAGTLAAGVYSVTQTINGCASPAGTVNVVVNPIPATPTAASNSTLCAGSTLSLTAGPNGAFSYNWTGPNTFTSAVQNPTIGGVTVSASGTYSVTQTVLGCTSAAGIVNVTVNPIPSSPTLTSNSPICALQTLSLNANPGGAISYSWTGPNSFTSSVQNPTIANTSTLASGTYSATQNVLGCVSPPATLAVVVNSAAPTPTVSSNSPICLNQTLTFSQTAIGGATYSWSGPNSFTSAVQNPTIANATPSNSGTYSLYATVAGCPGQTITVNVLVSLPGTVTPGSSPTVCANNSTVVLTGTSSTGSGTWTSSGTGTFSPNTQNGNYLPSNADISAGTVTLTLTSTNNGGCVSVSNTLQVHITPAPTASAGANQTVCANNATVALNGSVTIASGGTWSTSGTGTFVPNNAVLNASYVPSNADITAGSFTLTLTTTGNGNCFAVSNIKVITISPAPVVIPGANPQVVCKNNPNFQLNGSSTTGSGTWLTSGTGTFSPNNNILNPTYIPSTADTTAGSVTLTLTSTNNGGCNPVTATMQLVYVSTLAVNAGSNQTVCGNNATVSLNGVSTTSAGIWTSSGTGTFSPSASSLVTNYIPSPADILSGLVTLTLTTANNGGCNPIHTTMQITITPAPTASAGASQTVCSNNATVALNGSVTVATGGSWSSNGTGTFVPNNNSLNTSYIPSPADTTAGSVVLTLTTTGNGNCLAVTSTVMVNFTPAPLVTASNIAVCKNNPVAVLNGYSSTGSGTWVCTGTGTFSPNNSVLSPTYTPSTADTTAGSVTFTLTSTGNGGCNPVTRTVTITYSGIPSVTAGSSQTVCANNANVVLTGTSSTGSGTWTSSGTGSFSPNSINGVYVPSGADILNGIVILTVTSTNNGGCNAVSNQMTVTVGPSPSVNAGPDYTVCSNTSSINLTGSFSVSAGASWTTSGTGTFTPNNNSMNVGYIPSSQDTAAGMVTIYLHSTGNGNCLQVTDSMVINFIQAPFVNAGPDLNLCPNAANPVLTATSSVGSVTWTTLGSGSFSPNNTTLSTTYVPSGADNSAGSVTLVINTSSVTCGIAADTLVINFKPKPTASFSYSNVCFNSVTGFTDASVSMPTGSVSSWYWHFDADTSTIKNPTHTFTTTGTHTVTLLVSNGNCIDSIQRPIYINPLPTVSFSNVVMCHDSVQFAQSSTVTPGSIHSYTWNFGDNTSTIVANPVHIYPDSGAYIVNLTIRSDSGCVSSRMDTIHVKKCSDDITIGEPAVPTGFTPNGDGANDVLYVKGGPYSRLDFRVFNEWGNEIFHSTEQTTGWDGKFRGSPQAVGRYIWTVNGELINGKAFKMAGEVILNR